MNKNSPHDNFFKSKKVAVERRFGLKKQGECKKLTGKDLDGPCEFWMADIKGGQPKKVCPLDPIIKDSRCFVKWCYGIDDYGNSNIEEVELFETRREAWTVIIRKYQEVAEQANAVAHSILHNAIADGWTPLSKEQCKVWIDDLRKDSLVP